MKRYGNLYSAICELENLYSSLQVCLRGKRLSRTVLPFTYELSREMTAIQKELADGTYRVSAYYSFYVLEPKRRLVQALPFRDRIVQQALCQVINPIFENTFIKDSYACIAGRGTHAGSQAFQLYMRRAEAMFGKAYCLQCDIASYFASIDHGTLLGLIERKIKCRRTLSLIQKITDSNGEQVGIPIGNLLSQLSANIYLNALDHYVKEHLKVRYYVRYMDDFFILHGSKEYLRYLKDDIQDFLEHHLFLSLNRKTSIYPISQGADFLGYRTWTTHKLLRKRSVKKMRRKLRVMCAKYEAGIIKLNKLDETIQSWTAHARHADTYGLRARMFGRIVLGNRQDAANIV